MLKETDTAQTPIVFTSQVQQIVCIYGLMSAVESSHPDMYHPLPGLPPVVRRHSHRGSKQLQIAFC